MCLISSRQTDLWGFIDSKLHRGRHRAGSMERQSERGGRVLGKARIGREEGEEGGEGGREGAETDRETDRWKKRRRWESFDVMKQEAGRERGREKKRDQYEEGEYTPRI